MSTVRIPAWDPNAMYVDELSHFLRCVARREKPAQDIEDGARILELALAAKESAIELSVMDVRVSTS